MTKAVRKKKVERRAEHDENHPYPIEEVDGLTKLIAHAICDSMYIGKCACRRRPDMSICTAMVSAAKVAIRLVRESS
jgi:hypothetical protein